MSRVFDFIEVSHAGLHRSGASWLVVQGSARNVVLQSCSALGSAQGFGSISGPSGAGLAK